MKKIFDIIYGNNKARGKKIIKKLKGKNPLFLCTIGVTETGKILGLSAAGKNPDITDYTPPADVELLQLGKCKCILGVPVTPDGIPTPALITMSALKLADIPSLIVSAGLKVTPDLPFVDLGGNPGRDIRTGKALKNPREVLNRAKIVGRCLSKICNYIVIGESIPGGTTTALGVLLAMGIDARGRISSSMSNNPHELKINTVEEGLKNSGIKIGDCAYNPIGAVSSLGDPMLPALAGLVLGMAERIPVIMAGGTQMAAALAIVNSLNSDVLKNVVIGTTRWILNDKDADLIGLVTEIADVPILAADIDFSDSKYEGLRAYEEGVVKEGVGCGGAVIAAILKSNGSITNKDLLVEIEKNYKKLVS